MLSMSKKTPSNLLSEGSYHGKASASVSFFGFKGQTEGTLDVTITKKPNMDNTFDVNASVKQTSVSSGLSSFFPTTFSANAEVEVDEAHKRVTIRETVPFISSALSPIISGGPLTKTVDVIEGKDGSLSGECAVGPISVFGQIFR